MRSEALSFSKVSDAYERGRPGYPSAAAEWIAETAPLGPCSVVVDLAAGTGKFTRVLAETNSRVIAVEPLAEMRAHLTAIVPGVKAVSGTAEEMNLPDASADAVTVAQAFHWFSTEDALAEIGRVLKRAGFLALVWNERDRSQPLQAAIDRILRPYGSSSPGYESKDWRRLMAATARFRPAGEFHMETEQELDSEGLAERVGSTSLVAGLPGSARERILREIKLLAPDDERVVLQYDTAVYGYRKAEVATER